MSEYKATLEKVKYLTTEQPELTDKIDAYIKKLESEKNSYLNQLLDARHDLTQKDYTVENQKKALEQTRVTLKRYEKENRALRELVQLWI